MIDHEQTIAVAIECDAYVRPHTGDRELQQTGHC